MLDRWVWVMAGCGVALLLAVALRYGYHRDELYFLRAGQELAWGYVDQPPFTALVARIVSELFGGSLFALRLLPALSLGGCILVAGALAAEFGGNRSAQVLAAVCTALSGQFLGAAHLLSTTPFDFLAWGLVMLLVVRMVRTGNGTGWLWVGIVTGAALLNKWMIAFLILALLAGLLWVGPRRVFATPWIVVGAVIAIAALVPNLMWQADHGWPAFEVAEVIADRFRAEEGPLLFIAGQLLYPGPLSAPVWVAGLVFLAWAPSVAPYRFLVLTYALLFILFLAVSGKPYYLGAMYMPLFAAGGVAIERATFRGAPRARLALGFVLVGGIGTILIALPVLPERALATVPVQEINYDAAEQTGWPQFVRQVAEAYRTLPANRRADTAILAANYGEAGAIDRFGRAVGMPRAHSGHNNYWLWGPPPDSKTRVLAIGFHEIPPGFSDCRLLGRIQMPHDIDNDENGAPIVYCDALPAPWPKLWPRLQHFGRPNG